VVLECLGLTVGHVTTHRTLTARKVDTPDGQWGCPANWHDTITNAGGDMPLSQHDLDQINQIVFDRMVEVWRAAEMENLDVARANKGAHDADISVARREEFRAIAQGACAKAIAAKHVATDPVR